ncbi:hypothetical protein ABZ260_26755 [Streptosporangium sp. NPDC006013]|uniref:hypothetical protein n=1 Tax=Streptosporangium sp. NPDC006013 TaxID=3155596 RepID=UPI0033AE6697
MILLKVHAASWAVTGLPSDQVAPARMVKVQVSLSGEVSHDSARSGLGFRVLESGTVRKPYIQRWIDVETTRTARNGFIESMLCVAPSRTILFSAWGDRTAAPWEVWAAEGAACATKSVAIDSARLSAARRVPVLTMVCPTFGSVTY